MGHYDECREGYCVRCGQTVGNCEHTSTKKKEFKPQILSKQKTIDYYRNELVTLKQQRGMQYDRTANTDKIDLEIERVTSLLYWLCKENI